jgi:poly-gamma-glutamate capsule biosynthesis protein CapA/YwtB (metallophosphatase superfamily)
VVTALLGDVMLGRGVASRIARGRPPEAFWGNTLEVLHAADLVVANLECAVTDRGRPWDRTPKVFHFRAPPAATDVLAAARVDAVSLANNHVLDFQEQGLLDTLHHLDAAGIARAGAGRDAAEAARPALLDAGGIRLGLLAFTDNEPGWAAGHGRPGTNVLQPSTADAALARVESGVHEARTAGADRVILSLHWGPNMVLRPPERFRRFARAALKLGVDVVHGHSAHVVQGVEEVDGGLILYDTGDFLDDYAVHPELRNDLSFIFLVEMDREGVRGLELRPVGLEPALVNRIEGDEAGWLARRTRQLSLELGTALAEAEAGVLRLQPGRPSAT